MFPEIKVHVFGIYGVKSDIILDSCTSFVADIFLMSLLLGYCHRHELPHIALFMHLFEDCVVS